MERSLRWSSQKNARDATQSITLQAEEGVHRKSRGADGAHKRLVFGPHQVLEPTKSDPVYVPVSDSETTETDGDVMLLDSGGGGAPNTRNDFACAKKMMRAQRVCADARKMCQKSE